MKDRWASACSVCGGRSRIVDDDERVGVGPFGFGGSESPQAEAPPPRALRAHIKTHLTLGSCSTRAVLHDLDAAHSGRLRRGRCACPPPPLAPRAYRGFRPHRRPLRVCRTRLHFADRLRAGAGRRSGSGRRQGRVCWGRPLLSRPRGAVGSGPAAVESAAASVVALTCGVCVVGGFGWL